MTDAQRLDRIERLIQQDAENIHQLATVARTHDDAIRALTANAARQDERLDRVIREWQAYLTNIHPRQ